MTELDSFFKKNTLSFDLFLRIRIGKPVCRFHHHRAIEMVFHDGGGSGITRIRGHQPITFKPNSIVIYPPLAMHDQRTITPGLDICLLLATTSTLPALLSKPLYIAEPDDPFIAREFRELQRAWRGASGLTRCALDHRATALLARVLEQAHVARDDATPADAAARQAMDCILSDFGNLKSLKKVADRAGLSYHYLRHVFKHRYGITMKQALINARLDCAKELLAHSPLPQKAIAAECGFRTERYFSEVFRRACDLPPGAFRRRSADHLTRR